ncbi:DNA polymerase III subunit delta' [Psychrobacter aestuarii]|uniref:DNA-directed DNA polymerase n=1 Tax=Psychrobacter aestuarii TaxID=556327 RepID=A0ABP3FMF4_9GAMM|nr:DNA polymerase III subunit delta' [Psychrobacter aestuarii]
MTAPINSDAVYFAPLLPWQTALWAQLTSRVLTPPHQLPHALLAAGTSGLGKRAFVWRLVAWLLCRERETHLRGACGVCESCQWLKSGTHPSLAVLPQQQMPIAIDSQDTALKTRDKKSKSSKASTETLQRIKVDDIRELQPFIYQGGQGLRICVLEHAETMTVAASNALLKTLEEPQSQVHVILISDHPAQILPTIKSRVQQLPLYRIETRLALDYVTTALGGVVNHERVSSDEIAQLLTLAEGAPMAAIGLAQSDWYGKRALWLTTWQALRAHKRSSTAASDYWQSQLDIDAFIALSELMLTDIQRLVLGLNMRQTDLDMSAIKDSMLPDTLSIADFAQKMQQIKAARLQNVQDKFAYDSLMQALSVL